MPTGPVPKQVHEQVLHVHDVMVLARHGPVFINLWRGIPSVVLLEELVRHQLAMPPPHHVVLTIVKEIPKARMPEDAKAASTRAYDASRGLVKAQASYVEGTGFFAAAVRAVMASSAVFQRGGYPAKIFSRVDDASEWLAPHAQLIDAAYEPTLLAHFAIALGAQRPSPPSPR